MSNFTFSELLLLEHCLEIVTAAQWNSNVEDFQNLLEKLDKIIEEKRKEMGRD